MDKVAENIKLFVDYAQSLAGREKGEAQIFCDRLFQAFGHKGCKEAGATLEYGVKSKGQHTKFADLIWQPRLLLEMKSKGELLQRHYGQVFEYWIRLVPQRPKYVILCNFDEFWIYDFNSQLDDPVDKINLVDLPKRYIALNFLFPNEKKPQFGNDRVAVTRAAADKVVRVFNSLVGRKEDQVIAQRFILQCVMAMFSEDFGLLPKGLFSELLDDCRQGNAYDLIGHLFQQMNNPVAAKGGRYKDVPYFNGGLFKEINAIELTSNEIELLTEAAKEDWGRVQPPIFGTLFQNSMEKEERHAYGAHFTSEADIQKVVLPTIVRPWRERIEQAATLKDLLALRQSLLKFQVLDPACGSGNFLYVAYRELRRLEMEILAKIHENFGNRAASIAGTLSLVSIKQFYGIDINSFAVELAKVTLMLAKELALDETREMLNVAQMNLPLRLEEPLPLDNLDANIRCDDALFCEWQKVDAIIGNPPYQSKNKMKPEFGHEYVDRVRRRYPGVPGRADFCVYWFRRAHDELSINGRAGLVGTNTIRQNYSRQGGLDYVVENGGTITEAVSTQVWNGDAVVHVSIVNWIKGEQGGKKKLYIQEGDRKTSEWRVVELDSINSALSLSIDVTKAKELKVNIDSKTCYQGQTHGHAGFLLDSAEAGRLMADSLGSSVIHPYLIGDDLLGSIGGCPSRYIIDLNRADDVIAAMKYGEVFKHIKKHVLPAMQSKANEERKISGKSVGPRQQHFNHWWKHWRGRLEMLDCISTLPKYVVCVRVTKRSIFEFIHKSIHPNDALQVFALPDDYSFGILQSGIHWKWFEAKCSTMKGDPRYTPESVYNTFPWPQSPELSRIEKVAAIAVSLRQLRHKLMKDNGYDLRELYRTIDLPGKNLLKNMHTALDVAVRDVYGMKPDSDILLFLRELNVSLSIREAKNLPVLGPGLPPYVKNPDAFITPDCVNIL